MIAALLAGISEPEARVLRLVEWLVATDAADAVVALHADLDDPRVALASVHIRAKLPYDTLSALYVAADDAGLLRVKRLLFVGEASKTILRDGAPDNEFMEKTLGERKALAMTRDRDVIDRLMRDRNAQVITILLRNPRLTERDVVRIAAQQPIAVPVIEAIMHNHKWLQRYSVKKALVFNPYTPRNVARSLMPMLIEADRVDAERLLLDRDEV